MLGGNTLETGIDHRYPGNLAFKIQSQDIIPDILYLFQFRLIAEGAKDLEVQVKFLKIIYPLLAQDNNPVAFFSLPKKLID